MTIGKHGLPFYNCIINLTYFGRPVSSQYPNGHFVRSLGPIHELDTEISAILVEHDISVSQASQGFSEASLREMPIDSPESPWQPEKVFI